ncbi:MAG: hypothetical protein AB8H79_11780 [Myxococcota bacterium]
MSELSNQHEGPGLHPMHLALFMVGGACLGTGIILLYFAFGWPEGPLNSDFAQIGFNGLDNISIMPGAEISVALIVIGIVSMVFANATAWRETGGY